MSRTDEETQNVGKVVNRILVTGAAGFIGAHLCHQLVKDSSSFVIGIDNFNDYYDVNLKQDRLRMLKGLPHARECFQFIEADIRDTSALRAIFDEYNPNVVVNLAAQAGVRYSIENPRAYFESNLEGFFNILEHCRTYAVQHLVYASSSSVYGSNTKVPYSVKDPVDNPVSFYAATKRADELMAQTYSEVYGLRSTGLRFFTVYGPMGRPDMAYFKFTDRIVRREPIELYNQGILYRDFTYIDDIVSGVMAIIAGSFDETGSIKRHRIYNIGNSKPESLSAFVTTLEKVLLDEGVVDTLVPHILLPMQQGDVYQTYADVTELRLDYGFSPETSLEVGLRAFAKWYGSYYGVGTSSRSERETL